MLRFQAIVLCVLILALGFLEFDAAQYGLCALLMTAAAMLGECFQDVLTDQNGVRWLRVQKVLIWAGGTATIGYFLNIYLLLVPAYLFMLAVPFAIFWQACGLLFFSNDNASAS